MAVLRLDRILTAPVDAGEMGASNAALAAAAKYASPGFSKGGHQADGGCVVNMDEGGNR